MKRLTSIFLVLAMVALMVGCSAHIHTVGKGPQSGATLEARQWYVLFGLVPINDVDTKEMAAGATDYQIKTESSALDIIINIFTCAVSIYSRTVTVTK